MILEARGLAIGYRGHRIGEGLDLGLAAGRVLALLGPNGGGKTTLLKTLIGLIPPLAGRVLLDGAPLERVPVRERARRIAYVPQVHAGTFGFTVAEVALMGREARRGAFAQPSVADRAIAAVMLARLGIAHLAERPYTQVSGGERQLALIARALAQEPAIVVLDEPTASLDFGNQGRVLDEMRALAAGGLAVAFTTHDPNQAWRHADDVAQLRDGHILAAGPTRAVLTRTGLEALYGSPVLEVGSAPEVAFLPGGSRAPPAGSGCHTARSNPRRSP